MTSQTLVWIFDSGAEGAFPVSLYSLWRNARTFCIASTLVVIDCGVSPDFRKWLTQLSEPHVHIITHKLPSKDGLVGVNPQQAAQVMRLRIGLDSVLASGGELPAIDRFLQIDTDTIFLSSPEQFFADTWDGEHIRCCYEWDWIGPPADDNQGFMKLGRTSTFAPGTAPDQIADFASRLGFSLAEFRCVPTVNSGVWMSKIGSQLSTRWSEAYQNLYEIERKIGKCLNPYGAEQNALSLAVYSGRVLPRFMPRSFNQLPPREPHDWPPNTTIAHFITFGKNWNRAAYRTWFEFRKSSILSGFTPPELVLPGFTDPV